MVLLVPPVAAHAILDCDVWQGRRGVVPMDVIPKIQKPIAMYLVAMVDSCAGAIQSDLILS